ncbi:Rv3235 family protein [Rathayibacter sp. ZW T2_19]|uniref:Rv3235 family protein n=1 Tax=Rathayibacter rubneri TaxID=2950106 RepID=A0A9X2E2U3_9MICO|nr:Rv3235 family protein [Rathayibacter rubneri]MCM6763144.1 Rv3235 family protein [Rathayibacter rubneri]
MSRPSHAFDYRSLPLEPLAPSTPTAVFFAAQPATRAELPDPEPILSRLTLLVVEILAGSRDIDQIARWLTDDVYRHLQKRVVLAARARSLQGRPAHRIPFTVGRVVMSEPRDGVVEAVILVHNRVRTRAVAIRLEGMDNRWRATAVNVL